MIQFLKKDFNELIKTDLYALLKLRMEIFILEQRSFYLDLDDQDQTAVHIMGLDSNNAILVCYGRITVQQSVAKIQRVCVDKNFRGTGLGARLMEEMLAYIHSLSINKIKLDAQIHLQSFYNQYGFQPVGQPYDDGGVMHILMQTYE